MVHPKILFSFKSFYLISIEKYHLKKEGENTEIFLRIQKWKFYLDIFLFLCFTLMNYMTIRWLYTIVMKIVMCFGDNSFVSNRIYGSFYFSILKTNLCLMLIYLRKSIKNLYIGRFIVFIIISTSSFCLKALLTLITIN